MQAAAVLLTVVNLTGLSPQAVKHEKRVLTIQAQQLSHYRHTPPIRFGPGGWPVFLTTLKTAQQKCASTTAWGCHSIAGDGPYAVVSIRYLWTVTASHEVMEMLADPCARTSPCASRRGDEVSDPVDGQTYFIDGTPVSNFTLPNGRDFIWAILHDGARRHWPTTSY